MSILVRQALPEDCHALFLVEAASFPPEEAASEASIRDRLAVFPESFFLAEEDGQIIGLINGCASDLPRIEDRLFENAALHEPHGSNQMIFSLAVAPDARKKGIGTALLHRMIEESRQAGRKAVILTCKAEKIPFYQKAGFRNLGVSQSAHGGAVWYDMILELK